MGEEWDYADPATGLFSRDRFWEEKVSWLEHGNRTPTGQHCIRVEGHHFVALPGIVKPEGFMGHGGRIMRWIDSEGFVHESNDVWSQGDIPERFRDRLPDNAWWLPVDGPGTVAEGIAAALERIRA